MEIGINVFVTLINRPFIVSPLCSIVFSVVGVLSRIFITGFYVTDIFITSDFQISAAFTSVNLVTFFTRGIILYNALAKIWGAVRLGS